MPADLRGGVSIESAQELSIRLERRARKDALRATQWLDARLRQAARRERLPEPVSSFAGPPTLRIMLRPEFVSLPSIVPCFVDLTDTQIQPGQTDPQISTVRRHS